MACRQYRKDSYNPVALDLSGHWREAVQSEEVNGLPNPIQKVKCLDNILGQDHRFVRRITRPMTGFKAHYPTAATSAGIGTAYMIRKGQIRANGTTSFHTFADLGAQSCSAASPLIITEKLRQHPPAASSTIAHHRQARLTWRRRCRVCGKPSHHGPHLHGVAWIYVVVDTYSVLPMQYTSVCCAGTGGALSWQTCPAERPACQRSRSHRQTPGSAAVTGDLGSLTLRLSQSLPVLSAMAAFDK